MIEYNREERIEDQTFTVRCSVTGCSNSETFPCGASCERKMAHAAGWGIEPQNGVRTETCPAHVRIARMRACRA